MLSAKHIMASFPGVHFSLLRMGHFFSSKAIPVFSVYCRMNFLILGQSVGKEKKNKLKIWRSLELDGLVHVPENNICGAWKRQDEVTKSTWQHWHITVE